MKTLVTGNLGYIGSVLTDYLEEKNHDVIGLDIGYFEECNLLPVKKLKRQIKKDIKDININDLHNIDNVIHLAGLSNDPLGHLNPKLTEVSNYISTVNLAKMAKHAGVKRFIFTSSQSIYGISKSNEELDEYDSIKDPVTEYAKTKWKAEKEINKLNSVDFTTVVFRPATVFGASPRIRCDIVFNNLVACAYTQKKIIVHTDGKPWRPVIHIKDVCEALLAGIIAPKNIVSGQAYNLGIKNGNFTVRQIAEAAQRSMPESELIFLNEKSKIDPRTYKVSFNKIYNDLGSYYKPKWKLDDGAKELIEFFKETNFTKNYFNGYKTNRLIALKKKLKI